MKFVFAALSLASAIPSAMAQVGGPANMCVEQDPCLDFTMEKQGTNCAGDCTFKICMIIQQSNPLCQKDWGDSFSHTCVKSTISGACATTTGFLDAMEVENIGDPFLQCQFVPPGGVAEFLLKDGVHMDGETCHAGTFTRNIESASPIGGTVDCMDSPYPKQSECNTADGNTDCSCTSSGNECTWMVTAPATCSTTGGGGGDPHFQRWGLERDSFHGECDLVMVHSDDFHNKAGFDLHARTTMHSYYSYIESAAFRVGDYTVEIERDQFFINGVQHTKTDLPLTFGGDFKYTIAQTVDTETVETFKVDLHEDSSIEFKFYLHYLNINVDGVNKDFMDSVGLLGEYGTGDMYSRDGALMTNFEEYSFEWQVNPEDNQLFRTARAPQLPYEQCRMPTHDRPARRHLRADRRLFEQAQVACAAQQGNDFDLCVDDVMMTGDVGIAEAW
jgi:hypothetical protein